MKKLVLVITLGFCLLLSAQALAHTPVCNCWHKGKAKVTCEGGYSDGSSAAGVDVRVVDKQGEVLKEGKMNDMGKYTFEEPDKPYTVIFDAGPGHKVKVKSKKIF